MQINRLEYYGKTGQEVMACVEQDAVRQSNHQPAPFRGAAQPPSSAESLGLSDHARRSRSSQRRPEGSAFRSRLGWSRERRTFRNNGHLEFEGTKLEYL